MLKLALQAFYQVKHQNVKVAIVSYIYIGMGMCEHLCAGFRRDGGVAGGG
jgi:hypothetical protein